MAGATEYFDPFTQAVSTENVKSSEEARAVCLNDIYDTPEGQAEIAKAVEVLNNVLVLGRFEYRYGVTVSPTGGYFAYDLESVPDESRFPRPEERVIEPRSIVYIDALRTEKTVTDQIELGITPEQATDMLEMEMEKGKPRSGVVKRLQAAMQGSGSQLDDWKRLAVDPFSARIVALGVCHYNDPSVAEVMTATNEDEERELVQTFFDLHATGRTRVGYNISGFDDQLIMWRAMTLGVNVQKPLHVSKWGGRQSVDLMQKLFPGTQAQKLKTLLPALGIYPPAGDVNGSHVLDMVDGAQWEELKLYVASDAWSEMQLLRKVQSVLELG